MEQEFKKYSMPSDISIGDVVANLDTTRAWFPFNSCIVTNLDEEQITLTRPFGVVSNVTGHSQPYLSMEQFKVPIQSFIERYGHFTTGPSGSCYNVSVTP